MNSLYEKYKNLEIDGSCIGLEKGPETSDYFCAPEGARVIGWDNGIHYCFIDYFGEMVFCVNPETCCDYHVYPLAENFYDFLSLILATKNANVMQQIIWWDKKQYIDFINLPEEIEYTNSSRVREVLSIIRDNLNIAAMNEPFEYIKKIQKDFPYEKIEFSDEYYDTLGIARPDGKVIE